MLFDIIRYIRGYLKIRVTGYYVERFLNACSHREIYIWGLRPVGEGYEMNITIKGFRQLKPVLKKTGTRIVILKRIGLPFFLHKYRNRKMLFSGAVFFFFLIFFLSHFVWGIDISGNSTYTDEVLLKFLKSQDVKGGMRKSEVNCSRIAKDIRKEYGDIIWVSASIKGTKLYIQVKEQEDSIPVKEEKKEEKATDIVADTDCVITDITVRKGVVQVKRGQQVKKGEVLISGQVPVFNDAKEVTGYQSHKADADIRGTKILAYEEVCSNFHEEKSYQTKPLKEQAKKQEYTLTVGKYRFTLGNIKTTDEQYEVLGVVRQLRLSDSFLLPVMVTVREVVPYKSEKVGYTEKEQQEILSRQFLKYTEELEKKGVEILGNDVKIYREKDCAKAAGSVKVSIPVGEAKPSKQKEIPKTEEQQGETIHGNDGSSH